MDGKVHPSGFVQQGGNYAALRSRDGFSHPHQEHMKDTYMPAYQTSVENKYTTKTSTMPITLNKNRMILYLFNQPSCTLFFNKHCYCNKNAEIVKEKYC